MTIYTIHTDKLAQASINEVKKSGHDWLKYVESHPVQSMFFGVVILYALKGLFK